VNELLWYTGRGSGTVALVLLTLVMVLGIVARSGRPLPGLPRFTVADVHRNASLIALGLVSIHVVVLFLDPIAQLRLYDLVIPFDYVYRPLWAGLGVIGMEVMVVVVVTSLLRRRIGARVWRIVHWLSYAMWPLAWLHSWFIGTDAGTVWFRLISIGCAATVLGTATWRLTPRFLELNRPNAARELAARAKTSRSEVS